MAIFRERFGGDGIRVEPSRGQPLQIDVTMIKLPALGLLAGRRSALRSDFADGHDRLIFSLGSEALAKQFGREILLQPGDAIALSGMDAGSLTTLRTGPIATLEFPRGALVPRLADVGMCCGRRVPRSSPTLRVLWGYLNALHASSGLSELALQPLAVAHIYDLAALALGASREAEEMARGRGVRAARLQAIKADILGILHSKVSPSDVAAKHALSPRYLRMLFEAEGTSFTEFVREERLKKARSKLLSRRFDHLRISEIAYEVGFNDLSYFNRVFRHRYGQSPGELRERRFSGFLDEPTRATD
ncbi:MAG TPA: AraC family transcriptional regulator [Steroidobacteraceae bacterium]|nr:AraC family transcriptional regulator [Steroidobacteraceae bacterium]